MKNKRSGHRVEFRLPKDHPFFSKVPVGERQQWLEHIISIALDMDHSPDPTKTIDSIEKKVNQVLDILENGINVNKKGIFEEKNQEKKVIKKLKPAIKNPRALADF